MVESTRRRRVKEIFQKAMELPEGERIRYARRICGDDHDLLAEVQRLLEVAAETPDSFLEPEPEREISPGQILDHYRIEESLGRGGMGEVFRARDRQLDRSVALKVLPSHLTHDADRLRRFTREAKALATLNHPSIVTIYSVETAGEVPYLTMELVEGTTLNRQVPRGGLSLERFFELAVPLADALAAAHEKGIVHRDLKPGNIMVDNAGRAKILDFGLAKTAPPTTGPEAATRAATETLDTGTGVVLGTVGYMSPEQVRGEVVDPRSDVFSLGLVLYEMATGARAFDAGTSADLLSAILRDTPVPSEQRRPELPRHLSRVIRHCLEKDPERRYQSAKDVRDELEDLARELDTAAILESSANHGADRESGSKPLWPLMLLLVAVITAAGIIAFSLVRRGVDGPGVSEKSPFRSLAVLPFDNLMNDPEQDYFVEGMHEALITDLSKIGALRVISRTSSMRYAETDLPLPAIAKELDVDALIEGSVLRADGQVRITAQLIDGATDEHLWAESYDRDMGDVLVLLSEVAQAIAAEIEVTLTADQVERLTSAPSVLPEAQEMYLRAQYYFNSGDFSAFGKALELHRQAVELDPSFARGWAGLAGSYLIHGFFGLGPREEMIPLALEAAERSLELDPSLGGAHSTLGYVALFFDWDWDTAKRELELALELAPTDTMAYHGYADYLAVMRDCDGSVEQVLRGRRADPMGGWANSFVIAHLAMCRRYQEAIVEAQKAIDFGITGSALRYYLGMAHWLSGDFDRAFGAWREYYGADSELMDAVEQGYADGGPQGGMLAWAERDATRPPARRNPYTVASYFSAAGRADEAFQWLEQAFEQREPTLLHLTFHPLLDPIREDPRFDSLLRRIGIIE